MTYLYIYFNWKKARPDRILIDDIFRTKSCTSDVRVPQNWVPWSAGQYRIQGMITIGGGSLISVQVFELTAFQEFFFVNLTFNANRHTFNACEKFEPYGKIILREPPFCIRNKRRPDFLQCFHEFVKHAE